MTQQQQGDVRLYQTPDDGDIDAVNGLIVMNGGLETSAYLSLFGGNVQDDGSQDNPHNWWGNLDETDPALQYRSRTQNLTESLPAVPSNLRRIEEAVKQDLDWMLTSGVASEINVAASMPGLNRVQIDININAIGQESAFTFVENWKADT